MRPYLVGWVATDEHLLYYVFNLFDLWEVGWSGSLLFSSLLKRKSETQWFFYGSIGYTIAHQLCILCGVDVRSIHHCFDVSR